MTITGSVKAPAGYAVLVAIGVEQADGSCRSITAGDPLPILSPAVGPETIDRSIAAIAGSQLLVGTNPDRVSVTVTNPSDTAMAISIRPLASVAAPGAIPLSAGSSVTLSPCGIPAARSLMGSAASARSEHRRARGWAASA